MRLVHLELYRYTVPLTAPLVLQGKPRHVREGLLMRLEDDDGAVGWGEASPLAGFSREGLDEAERDLQGLRLALVGGSLKGCPVDPDGSFARWMDARGPAASARFAVELAAWHLWAEGRGVTLPEVVTPTPRRSVSLNGLVMDGTLDEAVAAAGRMRDAGFRAVKLKVGRRPVADDVARVRTVATALGPDVALRLDANRAWRLDEAAAFAEGVAGVPLEYVEEPLADPALLPDFARRSGVPVALDETLVGLPVEALDRHTYARAVVLKPTLLGGFVHALRLARRAEALGLTPVVSAAFETGLGLRGLVALAAALGDPPAGLDTYRRLAGDVVTPRLAWQGGCVDVTSLMQTCRTVNREMLQPIDVR